MRKPKLNRRQRKFIRLLPDQSMKIGAIGSWQKSYHVKSTPRPERRCVKLKAKGKNQIG